MMTIVDELSEGSFCITGSGKRQLLAASTSLSAEELQLLVMLATPGRLREIVRLFPLLKEDRVREVLQRMLRDGYLAACPPAPGAGGITLLSADANGTHAPEDLEVEIARAQLRRRGFQGAIVRRAARRLDPWDGKAYGVLLIEDDPYLVRLYEKLLEAQGCRTRSTGHRAGIRAIVDGGFRPDLVILDLNLPDIGGFDILHWLSAHAALGGIPVIVASGDTTRESVVRALALGADGYLTKPVAIDSLLAGVRAVLGLPAGDDGSTTTGTD
jgi:two-component system OmpR family response regulator